MTDVLSAKLDEVAAHWTPIRKALFAAVCAENLNDGHYINAYELTDRLYEALSLPITTEPGEVVSDCAGEGHDHPNHDWRTACLKCGVFRGSDLSTLTGKE